MNFVHIWVTDDFSLFFNDNIMTSRCVLWSALMELFSRCMFSSLLLHQQFEVLLLIGCIFNVNIAVPDTVSEITLWTFCGCNIIIIINFRCGWCLLFCYQFLDVPAARLIFEVTIEGSARKVITVRSALMLHNQLEDEIEVRLINQIRSAAGQLCALLSQMIVIRLNVCAEYEWAWVFTARC